MRLAQAGHGISGRRALLRRGVVLASGWALSACGAKSNPVALGGGGVVHVQLWNVTYGTQSRTGAALFRSNCAAVGGMRATANKSLWAWVKVSGMEAKGLVAAAPSRAEAWAS